MVGNSAVAQLLQRLLIWVNQMVVK